MSRLAVVAVDPGKITGVAVYYPDDRDFSSWERPCWEAVSIVEGGLDKLSISHLVVEAYNISARTLRLTRGENWSLESIGALRYLATFQHDVTFRLQQPSDMKFGTDWKLRRLGWYRPSRGGHMNAAARHMLKFLSDEEMLTPAQLEAITPGDES